MIDLIFNPLLSMRGKIVFFKNQKSSALMNIVTKIKWHIKIISRFDLPAAGRFIFPSNIYCERKMV